MEHNPYDILGVTPVASKAEITKAVALAMKRKQYPVDVIAKAQKSLMKPEERILADYLRPILPPVKRFKNSDLSALQQPVPKLVLLAQLDGLEQAIAQASQQELIERESIPLSLSELMTEGIAACKQGRYRQAIKYLEEYTEGCTDKNHKDYIQAQMWLIRAYHLGGDLQRAIALCQLLRNHPHTQVQTWVKKTLSMLSQEVSHV
ncbi:molecular chaperone DnaJ [Calothrix sp. FACHB-1219]|uniref:molecular chaperone DnaJ n=1 Tax=unclassified Calothrix TaxID=2619626 RepID=UPI0016844DDA|nr:MULTISPECIES: molecular chaperone DnaJ [unclassified Calothrix]MBD2204734.1 molecular chaperone DnaJ [Calothrix sp. FACHB-168]MBD2218118.1 molecular chaperone DnaJ [Calothrix sp. FACHB-1219]